MFSLQCYAPFNNKRCTNSTKDNKIHCPIHIKEGVKLYNKYKKICLIADTFNLNDVENMSSIKDKVTFLNKAYNIFISAYEARLKHRNRCITPECRDYGHDKQFILLQQKINTCEVQLECLYSVPPREIESNKVEEKEKLNPVILEQVVSFQKKRRNDDIETNRIIAAYIKENGEILKRRNKLIDICYEDLLKFTTGNFIYEQMISMLTMVTVLQLAKERKRYNKSYYTFNLNTPVIHSYTNIKDLFKDQDIGVTFSICRGLLDYPDIVCDMFEVIFNVWKEGNFNPKTCNFKYRIVDDILSFSVVK
jgi:hypothetical protein